ncbi:MAG: DNA translocase FtsK 4TM domain-containing protein [Desulfovibrio sp.]|nr:DNA translocase FtsK 4TM domain-containing protein [Desulfovibrio sp.]
MKEQSGRNILQADGSRLGRDVIGLLSIFFCVLVILSLATFDSRDPWLNHVVSGSVVVHNKTGLFGSYISGFMYDIFGNASWALPAFLGLAGTRRILCVAPWPWWRWTGFIFLGFCISVAGAASDLGDVKIFHPGTMPAGAGNISAHGGGILGHMIYVWIVGWLSPFGAFLVWIFSLILAMHMLSGLSLQYILHSVLIKVRALFAALARGFPGKDRVKESEAKVEHNDKAKGPLLICPPQQDAAPPPPVQSPGEYAHTPESAPPLQEEDIPPWVRDFEDGTVGISVPVPLEPAASGPNREKGSEQSGERLRELWAEEEARFGRKAEIGESPILSDKEGDATSLSALGSLESVLSPTALAAVLALREAAVAPTPMRETPATADFSLQVSPPGSDDPEDDFDKYLNEETPEPRREDFLHDEETVPAHTPPPVTTVPSAAYDKESSPAYTPPPGAGAPPVTAAEKLAAPVVATPPAVTIVRPPAPAVQILRPESKANAEQAEFLPTLDILDDAPPSSGGLGRDILEQKGRNLMGCLNDFGVQGELVGITPGPVVTMFEIRPAPGVRVARIANLSDDLALALKAVAVRIQAPVPGTDTVGIEIPNEIRETVYLKELLSSEVFQKSRSLLTIALGKDIAGHPVVDDLASMPHLLVAGATGAGKSVGINSIILSFLYKAKPEEVKFLLVDPKRVEMSAYADLPHLVHPVVTDMPMAKNALEWAVAEMERRYDCISRAMVRNIADYNAKIASFGDSPRPEGMEDLAVLPFLVIIIDEFGDVMMTSGKDVETSIVRLAQLARAAGIHLILATQRPSVDVVTGLIKANFLCRIAFQVMSKHDSRTILDTVGAEHLLGKGDMLFKPSGGKFKRLHGAFVSNDNVSAVVSYWKARQQPDYKISFANWGQESGGGVLGGGGGADLYSDPLYNEAVEFVRDRGKASISLLQRKFSIGFNKAARYVEQMEADGIIGPADGSKPRQVIM